MGRNFALHFGAPAISYFGTYLAPIAVAFAVLDLTGVSAYSWMCAMVFLPLGYAAAAMAAS